MAVTCERGELIDVRFCLTRDLRAFAICPDVARRSCRSGSISVSPPR
jgi:ribonuclease T2